ncbi:MAG: cell envelope integrity protein CreD [Sphingobacteriales bacterium]|nr:MAG: cell envelope integrity protein CreD [Sphingobacteriales bacterium]
MCRLLGLFFGSFLVLCLLLLPLTESKLVNGKIIETKRVVYLLPDMLKVDGKLLPEYKHRSLYDVSLFRSKSRITGSFNTDALKALKLESAKVSWQDARLIVGISDVRGLEDEIRFLWDGKPVLLEAGMPSNQLLQTGVSTPVTFSEDRVFSFDIFLNLKGSEHFLFTPVGRTTEMSLTSTWVNPSFDGQFLPNNPKVDEKGFAATWKVLQLSRSFPQAWIDEKRDIEASAFGVRLIDPTDSYSKTARSVKYAILFIALTFILFFFLEILQKRRIHPVQYLLVGFALCVFYTLLLSISEYTGFNTAYLIAASATVGLISFYVWGVFHNVKTATGFTLALSGLYVYIFILIQLQDYSLLFGSVGLFVIVAVLMYFSRKIDWYHASGIKAASGHSNQVS